MLHGQPESPAEPHASEKVAGAGAFGWLSNAAARDTNLTANSLVAFAFRCTFVGEFGLNDRHLRHLGLGVNAARRAISGVVEQGYLDRPRKTTKAGKTIGVPKRTPQGKWSCEKAKDRLTPKAMDYGASGKARRHLRRSWFGILPPKEMAVFLYARAGVGGGMGPLMCTDIIKRFGWSRRIADRVLAALTAAGCLQRTSLRASNGQYDRSTYVVCGTPDRPNSLRQPVPDVNAPHVKKPCNDSRCNESPCITLSHSHHTLPTGELPSRALQGHYTSRDARSATNDDAADEDQAFANDRILGWTRTSGEAHQGQWGARILDETHPDDLARIRAAMSTATLIGRIRQACRGRVHQDILTPAGAEGVRWLAAYALSVADMSGSADNWSAEDALETVMQAIEDRIGSCPDAWLNSLALIGQRVGGSGYSTGNLGQRIYERNTAPSVQPAKASAPKPSFSVSGRKRRSPPGPFDQRRAASTPTSQALSILRANDGGGILSKALREDSDGLESFLDTHGGAASVLPIMIEVLRRYMIDERPVGSVHSWAYFSEAIEDELHRQMLTAEGVRPGDVFCMHKRRAPGA